MIVTGPAWLHCLIPSCGLRRRIGSALRLKSLFGKLVGSSGILLFYSHLPDKKLVVYPNRRTMVCTACFSDKVKKKRKYQSMLKCAFFQEIGRGILDSTKSLILNLTAKQRDQRTGEQNLEEMRKKQMLLEENQSRLDKKLDTIISSLEKITRQLPIN